MFLSLINLFFPKVCSGCHSFLLTNESVICTTCRHNIPLTNHHLNLENEAFKKFYGKIDVSFAMAMLYYNKKGIVQELIHNLKYKGHQEIGTVLGEWYAKELEKSELIKTVDCIIPVPLHQKRRKERGYNQIETFGRALSTTLDIPYNDKLLYRKKHTQTQSKKTLLNRSEGITHVFDVAYQQKDHNKHYLLIDDVLTTGATLEACARTLLQIPGTKISIICIAIAHS